MANVQLSQDLGFLRVGAAAPVLRVADVDFNVAAIVDILNRARGEGVQVVTLPEMALTGYTIGDLVHHAALLTKA
jgi:NAD+ synthase (glutamine-hydrolysing)